ncbi:MAG: cytochrome-c peroxidase [Verrucomicrobia bacterium]|nr:cytochrome-c peroxidase [Verrucomicrobiota bacterium]
MARFLCFLLMLTATGLHGAEPEIDPFETPLGHPHDLQLPAGFPAPDLPDDYPLTDERINLGRALFYEGALSRDGRITCGSCHQRRFAYADRRPFSLGLDGLPTPRNSMPIFNVAWKKEFFWDGRAPSLRAQVLIPIQDHREMDESLHNVVRKLSRSRVYLPVFKEAFGTPEVTAERIAVALEQFLLARTSLDSKYEQSQRGEATLSAEEERGRSLFLRNSSGTSCATCHNGPLFTDHAFRNNGLTPTDDRGREKVTGLETDRAKSATPTLRNIALTAPYMHDSRLKTLEAVVSHYSSGLHRSPTLAPELAKLPTKGFAFTPADQAALVSFLHTLTDPKFAP